MPDRIPHQLQHRHLCRGCTLPTACRRPHSSAASCTQAAPSSASTVPRPLLHVLLSLHCTALRGMQAQDLRVLWQLLRTTPWESSYPNLIYQEGTSYWGGLHMELSILRAQRTHLSQETSKACSAWPFAFLPSPAGDDLNNCRVMYHTTPSLTTMTESGGFPPQFLFCSLWQHPLIPKTFSMQDGFYLGPRHIPLQGRPVW